ncbi:MAG: DMT family transporter [Flavobacteriaceae bacterium]
MSKRTLAIMAALGATTIYAINHTVAKGIMPHYVQAYGLVVLRVVGASLLFWLISPFGPKEKIERKDYLRMLVCALLGMGFNMLSFFKGLELSTPVNSAVIITTTPIIVLVLSAIFIKEKITSRKAIGITIGLLGALALIIFGDEVRKDAPNIPMGNFLFLLNCLFYGSYLILVKVLTAKYHPFTFMKWLFLLGILICLPFGLGDLQVVQWDSIPLHIWGSIAFVIIGTTFCTYLFNVFALTQLKASTLSAFIYVQPVMGILFAVATGQDTLTFIKITGASLVLLGVFLTTQRPKKTKSQPPL